MTQSDERAPLYEVEWKGTDDYIPDSALAKIQTVVLDHLPDTGFDLRSMQAAMGSVTTTIAFDGKAGPEEQLATMEAALQGLTVIRTLHANLVAARVALSGRSETQP